MVAPRWAAAGTGEYHKVTSMAPRPARRRFGDPDPEGWAIVARFQAGDRAAFGDFYARYYQEVHALLRRLGGSPVFADDHVTEVFLRARRGLATLQPQRDSPGVWLFRVATNHVTDVHRRAYEKRVELTGDVIEPAPDLNADPTADEALEAVEPGDPRLAQLLAALEQMPPAERRLILARHREGMSTRAVADDLHTSPGAVKARLSRAMRRLRAMLGLGGVDTDDA